MTSVSSAVVDPAILFGLWLPITFDILQAIGWLGNVALIITLFTAKGIRRHATWKSFCIAWVLSSMAYLILAVAGMQRGPEPPYGVCLAQAIFIYGSPTMCIYAMLACVIQLWNVVSHLTTPEKTFRHNALWQKCLLFVPYALGVVLSVTVLVIGLQYPDLVERSGSGIYCVISSGIPGKINAFLCVIAAITTLGLEISIGVQVRKHKKEFQGQAQLPFGMLVRVFIFTIIGFIGIGISLVFVTRVFSPLPNLFIALMPVFAFLIFGTQEDIIDVWLCRRSKRESLESFNPRASASKV